MKLFGGNKDKIIKDEYSKNVEITELVLVQYNIANNDYQHDSRVLYAFVSDKSFDRLVIRWVVKVLIKLQKFRKLHHSVV